MSYEVRTPVFEGPFDLLLHLILKQELDLWEVSLAQLVDDYVAELERMEGLDLDVATEFLLIAATLVDLKAKRLLPGAESVELDEELLRFEERDLLLGRLLECKTFKDVARVLEARLRRAGRSVARAAGPEEPFRSLAPDPLSRTGAAALARAARRALVSPPPPVVTTDHVAPIRLSVRDAVDAILLHLPDSGSTVTFRSLAAGLAGPLEVVVRFLGCLELYKQGIVDLAQAETFGELTVRRLREGEAALLDTASVADWDGDLTGEPGAAEPAPSGAPPR